MRWEHCRPSCVRSRFDKFWSRVSHSTRKQEQLFILQTGSLLASPWQDSRWLGYLYQVASGVTPLGINPVLKLQAGDWIEWRLPKLAVHLIAIKFTEGLKNSDHLEVFCAADCSGWHCVFSSQDYDGVQKGTVVTCGCDFLVQRFKVHMVSGDLFVFNLNFECILREV